jgi:tetratricopeptide (TPR) repeat protein
VRGIAYSNAGYLAWNRGEYERARAFLEQAIDMLRESGDTIRLSYALSGLGTVLLNLGDEAAARSLYVERLRLAEEAGDKVGIASALNGIAEVDRSEGNLVRAKTHYERSVATAREGGMRGGLALFLANLGQVLTLLDDGDGARRALDEATQLARELGHGRILRVCLQALAALNARAGEFERAARALGAIQTAADDYGEAIERIDLDFVADVGRRVEAAIGKDRLEALRAEGRTLAIEDAIALTPAPLAVGRT